MLLCPYCDATAERATGRDIYPHRPDLAKKQFWRCVPCGAYVGCHPGGIKPLGRLANAELRRAKMRAHAAFDPLWRSKRMTRSEAYERLAFAMHLSRDECHIGLFSVAQCERVVSLADDLTREMAT